MQVRSLRRLWLSLACLGSVACAGETPSSERVGPTAAAVEPAAGPSPELPSTAGPTRAATPDPPVAPSLDAGPPRVGSTEVPVPVDPAPPDPAAPTDPAPPVEPPEAEPPPEPVVEAMPKGGAPRVVIGRLPADATDERCDFEIDVEGVPAIREDGQVIVFEAGDDSYLGEASLVDVVGVSTVDESEVFLVAFRAEDQGLGSFSCRKNHAAQRAEAARLNAELATHRWRRLERLQAEPLYGEPYDNVDELPAAELPVVYEHRNGKLIAKIPGVKVLLRHPAPWRFDVDPDIGCLSAPSIQDFSFDRVTRVALVLVTFSGGDLCPHPGSEPHVLHLPAELIEECDRRPVP